MQLSDLRISQVTDLYLTWEVYTVRFAGEDTKAARGET